MSYHMEHPNRGKCIIFNHEFPERLEPEKTTYDVEKINGTFKRLSFIVETYNNYEYSDVLNKITELSKEDHTNNDCICIFVLSHSSSYDCVELIAKNRRYILEDIWKPFTAEKCITLAGKPKLFFFQTAKTEEMAYNPKLPFALSEFNEIPDHADFFFAFSISNRFIYDSQFFKATKLIFVLCDVLDKYAKTNELQFMLSKVSSKVAEDHRTMQFFYHNYLTWPAYFMPKNRA